MKKFLGIFVLALVTVVTGSYAQEKKEDNSQKILAQIGTATITLGQFQNIVDSVPPEVKESVLRQKDRLLDELVNQELLFQEGEALKLSGDTTVQQTLERARKQIIAQRLLQIQVQEKVKVTDADVKDYYEKNKEKFAIPERVRASHILVAQEKLAKELLEKIKKGADFSALASENSIDPSKTNGGDLGFFERGRMVPEFEKVAFEMKEGAVSDVVKTHFGFHIIKSVKKEPSRQMEFDEVRERLSGQLLAAKQQEEIAKILQDLKKKTAVQIHTELLDQVK